ncbi:MAG TPA: hypothetical protein VLT51_16265 [Anaerolineales bacterium]|nr:hypothetical protein [Anaerolineales bacterium]
MNKVILSDAMCYDVAKDNMGFLGHPEESKQATLYKAMYETVHIA